MVCALNLYAYIYGMLMHIYVFEYGGGSAAFTANNLVHQVAQWPSKSLNASPKLVKLSRVVCLRATLLDVSGARALIVHFLYMV